ncbi:MAG: hypothetical protein ACKOZL_00620 [Actinomycetes bacterium]
MSILRRTFAAISVLSISTAGVLVATPGAGRADTPGAFGVDGRAVTLNQSTGLDTRALQVSWSGFTPTRRNGQYAVNVVQCTANPTAFDRDCFSVDRYPSVEQGSIVYGATTKADGTGSALFEIRGALDLVELGCSAANSCTVLVYEITGNPVPAGGMPELYAHAPIAFAPSPADCPPVTDFDARIGGEASSIPLAYRIAGASCTAADPSILDVTESASNEGREAVLEGQLDLGITAVPATPAERAAHPEVLRVRYAPLDLTAVVVAFQLADPVTSSPITELTLSPRLVARLVSDTRPEELFADPEFRALNPGRRWPPGGVTHPLLRAEANADTGLVTGWINADAGARAFLGGADTYGEAVTPAWRDVAYPIDVFESRAATAGYIPVTGQRNVGRRLFYGVSPSNLSTTVNYTGVMGVVDLPTARRFGLSTARIVNAAGAAVAPTDDAILAGYRAMIASADGTKVANFASGDPAAYPLVKIDYGMVTNALGTDRIAKTARFITEAVGTIQDSGDLLGLVPLPAAERDQARAVATGLTALVAGIDESAAEEQDTTTDESSGSFEVIGAFGDDAPTEPGDGSGGAADRAPIIRRGLARFQPVVAVSGPARADGLLLVLGLGFITGLVALTPSAWSLARRLVRR